LRGRVRVVFGAFPSVAVGSRKLQTRAETLAGVSLLQVLQKFAGHVSRGCAQGKRSQCDWC